MNVFYSFIELTNNNDGLCGVISLIFAIYCYSPEYRKRRAEAKFERFSELFERAFHKEIYK